MSRLRYNGLDTTLGGSGLTNSATSVTFAAALTHSGGTNVPTITGTDYIPLSILDSTGKLSEVVFLTAYTAAATTGTIVRGMEGTTGVSHSAGDKVLCGPTRADMVGGSADMPPASPNAKDDEFDGTSSVSWVDGPNAFTTWDINTTRPGHARATWNSAANHATKYQAVPGSYPYTITAKLVSADGWAGGGYAGIALAPASPTTSSPLLVCANVPGNNAAYRASPSAHTGGSWSSSTAGIPSVSWPTMAPTYLRFVVASATSVTVQGSPDGWSWYTVNSAFNPGFTPGVMGIAMLGTTFTSYFDFFRVT